MNPEIQRYIWQECQSYKMILMPVAIGLIFGMIALFEDTETLLQFSPWAILLLGLVWGTRQAADSVLGEVLDRTWDAQRGSAIHPWTMTIGKLFGPTIYSWYAITIALIIASMANMGHNAMEEHAMMILRCLLGQATAVFMSLVLLGLLRKHPGRISFPQLAGLAAGMITLQGNINLAMILPKWYGIYTHSTTYTAITIVLFWAWAVLGCWRTIGREMTMPQVGWAWPSFLVFLCFYAYGFTSPLIPPPMLASALIGIIAWPTAFLETRNKGILSPSRWTLIALLFLGIIVYKEEIWNGHIVISIALFYARDLMILHWLTRNKPLAQARMQGAMIIGTLYALGAITGQLGYPTTLFLPDVQRNTWAIPILECALIFMLSKPWRIYRA